MNLKTTLVVIILLALFISPFILVQRLATIKQIECKSQYGPCAKDLEEELNKYENQKLFEANKNIKNSLSSKASINDFSIHFMLPDKLEVNVIVRKSYYALRPSGLDSLALADDEGYIVAFQESSSLPILETTKSPPNLGEKVDEDTFFALEVLNDMFTYYQAKEGKKVNDSLLIELKSGQNVIFPLEGDRKVLIASLGVVLNKLNSEDNGTKIGSSDVNLKDCQSGCTIDLRFRNPIIKP